MLFVLRVNAGHRSEKFSTDLDVTPEAVSWRRGRSNCTGGKPVYLGTLVNISKSRVWFCLRKLLFSMIAVLCSCTRNFPHPFAAKCSAVCPSRSVLLTLAAELLRNLRTPSK